jgi:hypothetical protein
MYEIILKISIYYNIITPKMTDTLYYHDFISNKKIQTKNFDFNIDAATDYLTNHPELDGVIDNAKEILSLQNVGVLGVDADGNYYHQYTLKRYCDIIQNIRVILPSNKTVKVTYYIGGVQYQPSEVDAFIFLGAMFHECDIRITFLQKPNIGDVIEIHSDKYLLRNDHRRTLYLGNNTNKKIRTNTLVYEGGLCRRLKQ